MLKVEKKSQKEDGIDVALLTLSGTIDETVNFEKMFGTDFKSAKVYSKEVSRINSVGVKHWIKYFQELNKKGIRVEFNECSPAITEQLNLISNFDSGGKVISIYVPYACTNCKNEMIALFQTSDLKQKNFELPEISCSKCGSPSVFDDIEEEYFHFLEKSRG